MWEKKSELEGSNDLSMVDWCVASFAALSTFSLPGIPLWPRTQTKTIGIEAGVHVSRRMCIRGIRGGEAEGWEIALSAKRESETIKTGWVDGEGEVARICCSTWNYRQAYIS